MSVPVWTRNEKSTVHVCKYAWCILKRDCVPDAIARLMKSQNGQK